MICFPCGFLQPWTLGCIRDGLLRLSVSVVVCRLSRLFQDFLVIVGYFLDMLSASIEACENFLSGSKGHLA